MKVVINPKGWGIMLSDEAIKWLKDRYNISNYVFLFERDRSHSLLIECCETLGDKAAWGVKGTYAFKILDIPDAVKYEICERDVGGEYVREISRMWC